MIYLLRHGEIEQGKEKRFVGQVDFPLNENGLSQACLWRQKLKAGLFEKIYSSDLRRARETALIIADNHPEKVQLLPELREISLGEWEGLFVAEVQVHYPEEWQRRERDLVTFRPPGGESFRDLAVRIGPVFNQIVRAVEGNILIVGHAGVNRVILCQVLGMDTANLFRLGQDYGCMNLLERNKAGWLVVAMNILVDQWAPKT
ncbi:MAG TPA: alpha-ribazole phosphatase [Syntrophales bacterium]|nr:alpha-ribazole phosphatase [Syntrophales bacterium]